MPSELPLLGIGRIQYSSPWSQTYRRLLHLPTSNGLYVPYSIDVTFLASIQNVKAANPMSIAPKASPMAPPIMAKALNSTSSVKYKLIVPMIAAVSPV